MPGDDRGLAPKEIIGTDQAHPANKVIALQGFEHSGQIMRVVLQIAIQGGDDRAAGKLNAGPKRGALPAVFGQAQAMDTPVSLMGLLDSLPGLIAARVIDK